MADSYHATVRAQSTMQVLYRILQAVATHAAPGAEMSEPAGLQVVCVRQIRFTAMRAQLPHLVTQHGQHCIRVSANSVTCAAL